jgi:hypothetical protein
LRCESLLSASEKRPVKKEKVPSDPISSLVHRGHATALNIAFRSAVRPAASLHENRFFPISASSRCGAPQLFFSVTEPFARNGLSLTRNGSRFRGLHSGVNGPGLLLRSLAARLARPFGFSAPPPESVSPNPCGFLASCPLRVYRSTCAAALPISTPLQEFLLPRDQSVQQALPLSGSSSESTRSPLAPRHPIYC